MSKVVRDGKVAVLYSPGYGAGWYSWNQSDSRAKELLFDSEMVDMVERGAPKDSIEERAKAIVPNGYFGGVRDLEIYWIKEGTAFRIDEYDGYEAVIEQSDDDWVIA